VVENMVILVGIGIFLFHKDEQYHHCWETWLCWCKQKRASLTSKNFCSFTVQNPNHNNAYSQCDYIQTRLFLHFLKSKL
jgi:hypothetical protein